MVGGVALLGEMGKLTAVSFYRFPLVERGAKGITVTVQGKPGEMVQLVVAHVVASSGHVTCSTHDVSVAGSGRATLVVDGVQ